MTRIIVTLALVLLTISGFSQRLRSKKIANRSATEYYTVEGFPRKKHGATYKICNNTKDTIVSGWYNDDAKVGTWWHYTSGKRMVGFDFDSNNLLYISPEHQTDSVFILDDDDDYLDLVDTPPIFLGSKQEFNLAVTYKIFTPNQIMQNQYGRYLATITIDKQGTISDIDVKASISKDFENTLKKVLEPIKNMWIPAIYNGKPVESKFLMMYDFVNTQQTHKNLTNSYIKHYVIAITTTQRVSIAR